MDPKKLVKNSLFGQPIVYTSHLRDIEKLSIEQGAREENYIENIGFAISEEIQSIIASLARERIAILLLGKGNNAADALTVGCYLQKKGFTVYACLVFSKSVLSPLHKKIVMQFQKQGGKIVDFQEIPFTSVGCIIDGIFGSGYQNKTLSPDIIKVIEAANHSTLPIFSIDIPSGLNGDTGVSARHCIQADYTFYLGYPKIGFFIQDGYNYIGKLVRIDFGLEKKFEKKLRPVATLINAKYIPSLLPIIRRTRHKYKAGYVITVGGSIGMEGAGILSAISALKVGAGISRLFSSSVNREMPLEVLQSLREKRDILQEGKRCHAAIIGPGLGMDSYDESLVHDILRILKIPLIIDADGINICARHPMKEYTRRTIFTPHHKELLRLLQREEMPILLLLQHCQDFVDKYDCILVYKGAPTWIFNKDLPPVVIARGDPGMATAGTGDVLAGMIGGFVAQGLTLYKAALLGVYLHAVAGEIAASQKTSYCVIASDIILALPDAFFSLYDRYQDTKCERPS